MTEHANQIAGTYRNGRIDLDTSVNWPEGSRVNVVPVPDSMGLRGAEWVDSPESRNAQLVLLDAIEPLLLTPQDEAEITQALQVGRDASIRGVREQMGLRP